MVSKKECALDNSIILDTMICMKQVDIFKALSNEARLKILEWLKEPDLHFTPHEGIDMNKTGVCVSQITEKLEMTQSTASHYLSMLLQVGLIKADRIGKYTYYKRNEDAINGIAEFLKQKR